MVETFHSWLVSNSVGDYSSFISLLISFVGFGFTIKYSLSSRRFSEEAKNAVDNVKVKIRREGAVSDFSSVIAELEEVKRINRSFPDGYEQLPDKYAGLRKSLIQIRSENPLFTDEDQTVIQQVITQLSTLESEVEKKVFQGESAGEGKEEAMIKQNPYLSQNIDKLCELLFRLRNSAGEENGY